MVKLKKRLLVVCLLLVLLSFSVLAASKTPLGVFGDSFDFLKGLFSGTASIDKASAIAFILYLILFLALFMEGIRIIPLFGQAGEMNRQGRIFAAAAAGLSTIALFTIGDKTGQTMADRVPDLLAPFGIYGAVALAGIAAWLSFRFIRNSGVFGDQVMIAMGIALSVALMFVGFILTYSTLAGWGFLLLLLVMIVGAVRYWFVNREATRPEREARRDTERQREVEYFEGRERGRRERRDREAGERTRRRLFGRAERLLLDLIQRVDRTNNSWRATGLDVARFQQGARRVRRIRRGLNEVRTILTAAEAGAARADRATIRQWNATRQTIFNAFETEVINNIPPGLVGMPTAAELTTMRNRLTGLRGQLGALQDVINEYVENGTTNNWNP